MNRKTNEYLPVTLNILAGIGVTLISPLVELHFQISKEIVRPLGLAIVMMGMSLLAWAAANIKRAFLDEEVEPRLDVFGAFGLVRSSLSEWLCMSMKPGLTTNPHASIAFSPVAVAKLPILTIFPSLMPMSAANHGLPVPSMTRPFLMIRSNCSFSL